MHIRVVSGAILQCSFGAAPSTLKAILANRVMASSVPARTIQDHFMVHTTSGRPRTAPLNQLLLP